MNKVQIDYVEFKALDLVKTKTFYKDTLGWQFTDYGPSYTSFSESGISGGFELTDQPIINGALIVLYHEDLETIQNKITAAGGTISEEIFEFPGGRRFHFFDPSGNELAIWSDQ